MNQTRKIPLVDFLEKNREDRGMMANLRRGLGKTPGTAIDMLPYVCRFLSEKERRETQEAKFLIASLFAWHPVSTDTANMGRHYKNIWLAFRKSESVEQRFRALLNSHLNSLPYQLRQAISLAKSKEIPINWHQLYSDVINWGHSEKFVQKNWAQSFWS